MRHRAAIPACDLKWPTGIGCQLLLPIGQIVLFVRTGVKHLNCLTRMRRLSPRQLDISTTLRRPSEKVGNFAVKGRRNRIQMKTPGKNQAFNSRFVAKPVKFPAPKSTSTVCPSSARNRASSEWSFQARASQTLGVCGSALVRFISEGVGSIDFDASFPCSIGSSEILYLPDVVCTSVLRYGQQSTVR